MDESSSLFSSYEIIDINVFFLLLSFPQHSFANYFIECFCKPLTCIILSFKKHKLKPTLFFFYCLIFVCFPSIPSF